MFYFLEEAFKASGIETQRGLRNWIHKLDLLLQHISDFPASSRDKGEALFNWLWKDRPYRYHAGGNFLITEVIDAQLNPQATSVGNCLGLTTLFNLLAQHLGLNAAAIHMEEAFGTGPHVLSLIYTEEGPLQVENIFPYGFTYKAHKQEKQTLWGEKELIADIYNSRGTESFLKGNPVEALVYYKKALTLNPSYLKLKLNMGLTLAYLGREREATKYLEVD